MSNGILLHEKNIKKNYELAFKCCASAIQIKELPCKWKLVEHYNSFRRFPIKSMRIFDSGLNTHCASCPRLID